MNLLNSLIVISDITIVIYTFAIRTLSLSFDVFVSETPDCFLLALCNCNETLIIKKRQTRINDSMVINSDYSKTICFCS